MSTTPAPTSWAKVAAGQPQPDTSAAKTAAAPRAAPPAAATRAPAAPAAPVQQAAPVAPQPVAAAAPVETAVAAPPAPVATPAVAPKPVTVGGPKHPHALYFGNLHPELKPKTLADFIAYALGKPEGGFPIGNIRIVHDFYSRKSAGYGYVNFDTAEDAKTVEDKMNFMPIMDRQVRIMRSQRDPTLRKTGKGNLYVSGLDKSIDGKQLHATFSVFGQILCAKLRLNKSGQSTGAAYVQYEKEEDAMKAIDEANGKYLQGSQVTIQPYKPRDQRPQQSPEANYTNVYVKDFDTALSLEKFTEFFSQFGKITSPKIMMQDTPTGPVSKGFGFVAFETHEAAKAAVEGVHGKHFEGISAGTKPLYCQRAMPAAERERLREQAHKQRVQERDLHCNLFVKPLAETCTDEDLRAAFAPFGEIASTRVRSDAHGRKHGFVSFINQAQGQRALHEMNGLIPTNGPQHAAVKKILLPGQTLFVALAQKKADRERLFNTAMIMQGAPNGMPAAMWSMFNPHMMPRGFRPDVMIHPTAMGGYPQQGRPPVNARAYPPRAHPHPHLGYAQAQRAPRPQQPDNTEAVAVHVASLDPEARRQYLGDKLYPKVLEQLQVLGNAENAPRITGMLLELEDAFSLLESEQELIERVKEAISILENPEAEAETAQ